MGTALKMNLAEKSSSFKTWNKEHHQPGNSLHTSNWEQKPYSRHLMSAIHNWSLWSQLPCEELRCGAYLSDGGWGGRFGKVSFGIEKLKTRSCIWCLLSVMLFLYFSSSYSSHYCHRLTFWPWGRNHHCIWQLTEAWSLQDKDLVHRNAVFMYVLR